MEERGRERESAAVPGGRADPRLHREAGERRPPAFPPFVYINTVLPGVGRHLGEVRHGRYWLWEVRHKNKRSSL